MFDQVKSTPPNRYSVAGHGVRLFLLLLTMALMAASMNAQSAEDSELRDTVVEQYQVLPVRSGVMLTPKEEASFDVLEVGSGALAIDGREADIGELAALVGREQADPILNLVRRSPEELRELFGFERRNSSEATAQVEASQRAQDREEARAQATQRSEEARAHVEAARQDEQAVRKAMREDRVHRAEQLKQELAEIEETHRAITEELEERSSQLRERERDVKRSHRDYSSSGDPRVVVGSSVVVNENESVGDVVAVGGSVTVNGEVDGDAVAIGGTASVNGEVSGGVVSVGGAVHLGDQAVVEGDVVSVGGKIHRSPGARVEGQTTEVNMFTAWLGPWMNDWDWEFDEYHSHDYFDGAIGDFVGDVVWTVLLGIVGLLLILFMRNRVERAAAYAGAEPVKAGVVGLVVFIMFVPVLIAAAFVLAISIVGIPLLLLLPVVVVGFMLFSLAGYVSVAYRLGRWSQGRFGWRVLEPVAAIVIGLFWLHGWDFIADIVDIADSSRDLAGFLVVMLALFGFLVQFGAWCVGLGAMLLSWGQGHPVQASLPPVPSPTLGATPESSEWETPSPEAEAPSEWVEGEWSESPEESADAGWDSSVEAEDDSSPDGEPDFPEPDLYDKFGPGQESTEPEDGEWSDESSDESSTDESKDSDSEIKDADSE